MNIAVPTWNSLASVLEGKTESVFVSSPWFSTEGIEKLNTFLPDKKVRQIKNIEIWFRMNVDDHLLGITDYESLLGFAERIHKQSRDERFKLYASDNLHAKIYASDKRILITSANLTKNGFVDNVEIGVDMTLSAALKDSFVRFTDGQRRHLDEVPITKLRNFVRQLKSKNIRSYNVEISKILRKARKQMLLLALEEKFPPHSKFPIR
jgi:phosphatidylserine/phosphatidylglycerophosphate/cardiolipin synthase-like enzyme